MNILIELAGWCDKNNIDLDRAMINMDGYIPFEERIAIEKEWAFPEDGINPNAITITFYHSQTDEAHKNFRNIKRACDGFVKGSDETTLQTKFILLPGQECDMESSPPKTMRVLRFHWTGAYTCTTKKTCSFIGFDDDVAVSDDEAIA